MDISVIVPVFNTATYLKHCIDALETQDYPRDKYEIIMVDNNSTDGSDQIAAGYPAVRLLRESKQGSYAARNRGISEAAGSIIAFTDSDCAPMPDWLKGIAGGMNRPEACVLLGQLMPARNSKYLAMFETYQHYMREYIFNSKIPELYFGYAGNMAVRRGVLNGRMPFVERRRGADSIFVNRLVHEHSCDVVTYYPEMVVRHLEITGLSTVYRKMSIYGRSVVSNSDIIHRRAMTMRERLSVFRCACKAEGLSLYESTILIALLGTGLFFSKAGRWRATRF